MEKKMIDKICLWLTVIGGINWGLVGAFDFNLLTFLFGFAPIVVAILEIIVGIAACYTAYAYYNK
ncbi:MAG: DUF378 domain-containing protein [Alphaproteobacteria bacterium]|jgi:uncharacterized membrane protein YuzA (DUF378 family)|nr:DUF378 domain-containing protein [Alphaproteobacteria bacterium]MBR3662020.1 DUF378 domain-containing protein [Alphaproteobacteria bacterium]